MGLDPTSEKTLATLAAEALVAVERLIVHCREHELELAHAHVLKKTLRQLEEEYKEKGLWPRSNANPPKPGPE